MPFHVQGARHAFPASAQAATCDHDYRAVRQLNETNWLAHSPALLIGHRNTYKGGAWIEPDPSLDWAANLAHQMGARQGGS